MERKIYPALWFIHCILALINRREERLVSTRDRQWVTAELPSVVAARVFVSVTNCETFVINGQLRRPQCAKACHPEVIAHKNFV